MSKHTKKSMSFGRDLVGGDGGQEVGTGCAYDHVFIVYMYEILKSE